MSFKWVFGSVCHPVSRRRRRQAGDPSLTRFCLLSPKLLPSVQPVTFPCFPIPSRPQPSMAVLASDNETYKMINRTGKQLPYILACAIAAFLGFSGLAQGQFEEFAKTFCGDRNCSAVGAAVDSAATDLQKVTDSKGRSVIELFGFKSRNNRDELCDL